MSAGGGLPLGTEPGLTRAQARAVDRIAVDVLGMSSLVLMENAGLLAALRCLELRVGRGPVLVLCGPGNNGGDGLVLARQLALRSVEAEVVLCQAPRGDAAVQRDVLAAAKHRIETSDVLLAGPTPPERWAASSLIVDAVLGTGFEGSLRGPAQRLLGALAGLRSTCVAPLVALDLPSGLDCDSGQAALGCVAADRTLTFAARKRAFDSPPSEAWTGPVEVLPIGVPAMAIDLARAGG